MSKRLTSLAALPALPAHVIRPAYDPGKHAPGIVHLGISAFHRAHQCVYTDDALAAAGGDWRSIAINLRSNATAKALTEQNGLFSVITRGGSDGNAVTARVIASLAQAMSLPARRKESLAALLAPTTRIVSITVTEKGYGMDRSSGGMDRRHPAIARDLQHADTPQGLAGLLVWAIGRRHQRGIPPFTLLCCDNLPDNGAMLRQLLLDFARHSAPRLETHIATQIAFPATMVDRITPAPGPATLAAAQTMTAHQDLAAVETEPFRQWVIEEDFPNGRPQWEAGGAIFTDNVRPYETMKLRMLNGTHSMLAWAGFLAGHNHVRDAMQDAPLAALARRHLQAAAETLHTVAGVNFTTYAENLLQRFANPHLAHETKQIAADSTEKLPQRIIAPALDAWRTNQPLAPFAFATAAWMRYTLERDDNGDPHDMNDPHAETLRTTLRGATTATDIATRLLKLSWLFPPALAQQPAWRQATIQRLETMLTAGMRTAITHETTTPTPHP